MTLGFMRTADCFPCPGPEGDGPVAVAGASAAAMTAPALHAILNPGAERL